jgi:hypothetical protein
MQPTLQTLEKRLPRLAAAAGVVLVAAIVAMSQVARGTGVPTADVVFVAAPTGELTVTPAGSFLQATALGPGDEASGRLGLTNLTGKELSIEVRALPESRDLDPLLRVSIEREGERVFDGTLGGLRRGASVVVSSGSTAPLDFRAWLPNTVRSGYGGRVVSVNFELESRPTGA